MRETVQTVSSNCSIKNEQRARGCNSAPYKGLAVFVGCELQPHSLQFAFDSAIMIPFVLVVNRKFLSVIENPLLWTIFHYSGENLFCETFNGLQMVHLIS